MQWLSKIPGEPVDLLIWFRYIESPQLAYGVQYGRTDRDPNENFP